MRALTMAGYFRKFFVAIALAAVTSLALLPLLTFPATAQTFTPPPPPPPPTPSPTLTGTDSSGASINGLANQRFNQIITNRVLANVLLGVNEQINCSDCVSAFGSAGSFSAGIHGRKEITSNLSLLAGLAYTQYGESGYNVTSAPIGAFALRYDFTDWGSSRPFFDVGTILTPFEKVSYGRSYTTKSRRRRAARFDQCQRIRRLWQSRLDLQALAARRTRRFRRDLAVVATREWLQRLDRDLRSVQREHRHRYRSNQSRQGRRAVDPFVRFQHRRQSQRRVRAVVRKPLWSRRHRHRRWACGPDDRKPVLVRIWRPDRIPHHQGLDRRSFRRRHAGAAAGRQQHSPRDLASP